MTTLRNKTKFSAVNETEDGLNENQETRKDRVSDDPQLEVSGTENRWPYNSIPNPLDVFYNRLSNV